MTHEYNKWKITENIKSNSFLSLSCQISTYRTTNYFSYSLLLFVITVLEAGVVKRYNKRFAGFNVAGIGGTAGCVVVVWFSKIFERSCFNFLSNEERKSTASGETTGAEKKMK